MLYYETWDKAFGNDGSHPPSRRRLVQWTVMDQEHSGLTLHRDIAPCSSLSEGIFFHSACIMRYVCYALPLPALLSWSVMLVAQDRVGVHFPHHRAGGCGSVSRPKAGWEGWWEQCIVGRASQPGEHSPLSVHPLLAAECSRVRSLPLSAEHLIVFLDTIGIGFPIPRSLSWSM